jgi:hypothetical protein
MSNSLMHDYEQVRIILNESVVDSLSDEVVDPDLSFTFGSLKARIPVIFFYTSEELDERTERVCEEAGVLTCGAVGSKIPLMLPSKVDAFASGESAEPFASTYLYEVLDPGTTQAKAQVELIAKCARSVVVGCSVAARHGKALANELRFASALLVGPTQPSTFKDIDTLGMATPRVSLTQELSRSTNVPVFATAGSAADTCKALVAGADAVVINIGGPFGPDEDVEFVVNAVSKSLHENIERLCKLAGAKTPRDLMFRCRLTPAR